MRWAPLCECPGGKHDSTNSFAKLRVWKLLERHFSMSPQLSPASPCIPPRLGQFAWALLALGWMLAVPLSRIDSPSMVQASVSSVSPYSPFTLDTGHRGSASEPARRGHSRRCKSRHSLAREGVCLALKHIQCTESAALLYSLLNPEKRREQGLS